MADAATTLPGSVPPPPPNETPIDATNSSPITAPLAQTTSNDIDGTPRSSTPLLGQTAPSGWDSAPSNAGSMRATLVSIPQTTTSTPTLPSTISFSGLPTIIGSGATPSGDPFPAKPTPTGAIAGGVVGGILFLMLILTTIIFFRRRKQAQRLQRRPSLPELEETKDPHDFSNHGTPTELATTGPMPELDPKKGETAVFKANQMPERGDPGELGERDPREMAGRDITVGSTDTTVVRGERRDRRRGDGGGNGENEKRAAKESEHVKAQKRREIEWLEAEEVRIREKRKRLLGSGDGEGS